MRTTTRFLAALVLALAATGVAGVAMAQEAAPAPTPAPPVLKPYQEVIKLFQAGLSEDFIKRKIDTEGVVFDLGVDDIVACKQARLPESLIEAMMATRTRADAATSPAARTAPAPAPAPVSTAVPPPPPPAPADLAGQADRTWEGVVRRNSGIVLFKSRWDVGTLSFRDEKLMWLDADEEGKNLIIPGRGIKEQFVTCLKGTEECFEWGVKTEDGEYRFRDVSWDRGVSDKPSEIFDFFKAIYPNLIAARYPADKK